MVGGARESFAKEEAKGLHFSAKDMRQERLLVLSTLRSLRLTSITCPTFQRIILEVLNPDWGLVL